MGLTVSDGKLSVTAPSVTVSTRDLSGSWRMTPYSAYPWADEYLTIRQNGTNLTGTASYGGTVGGTVRDPRHVSINFVDGARDYVTLEGDADTAITRIPVTFNHLGYTGTCTLERQ